MDSVTLVKDEITILVYQTYGGSVGMMFKQSHETEVMPIFVQNSYIVLKQNMGKYKASEQLDKILSKYGISVSSYE